MASTLAIRVANDCAIDDVPDLTWLLGELRYVGASEAFSTLASRAANGVTFNQPRSIVGLLKELRYAGADGEFHTLLDRAANAGLWQTCLRVKPGMAQQYKFGREPTGAASSPWRFTE